MENKTIDIASRIPERKVIDIADRIPTLRERRRKRSNLKFLILIIIFVVTLFLLLYFQSPYSEIKTIKVTGAENVKSEKYIEKSSLNIGDSIWGFSKKKVQKNIKEFSWVKNVKIKRKLLTTVVIEVEEYKKVAYIYEDNTFHPVLESGDIAKDKISNEPVDAPVFINFTDDEKRTKLINELSHLNPSVLEMISEIYSKGKDDSYGIILFMNDGYEVRGEINSLAEKLNYYPSIVAQIEQSGNKEKGIIDIEVGTYYRPFSDEYGNQKKAKKEKKGVEDSE